MPRAVCCTSGGRTRCQTHAPACARWREQDARRRAAHLSLALPPVRYPPLIPRCALNSRASCLLSLTAWPHHTVAHFQQTCSRASDHAVHDILYARCLLCLPACRQAFFHLRLPPHLPRALKRAYWRSRVFRISALAAIPASAGCLCYRFTFRHSPQGKAGPANAG